MNTCNNKLLEKADSLANASLDDTTAEAGIAKKETVDWLVDRWATLNLVRAVITGTAAVAAAVATLNPVEIV
jgi:hypothetical protein